MVSAVPIDSDDAFATAIATVQERFAVRDVDVDAEHGVFSTLPQPVVTSDAVATNAPLYVSYVISLGGGHAASWCSMRRARCSSVVMRLEVTPVAFAGGVELASSQVPQVARDTAQDLVTTIHWREQQHGVVH
jgi:hypothetical protein